VSNSKKLARDARRAANQAAAEHLAILGELDVTADYSWKARFHYPLPPSTTSTAPACTCWTPTGPSRAVVSRRASRGRHSHTYVRTTVG